MKILLVAATKLELDGMNYDSHGNEISTLITGVGTAATVYQLQRKLNSEKFDWVIQAGIAGSFDNHLPLTEPVIVLQDTFGDLGTEEKENFTTIFESGLAYANEFPYTNGWLCNVHPVLEQLSYRKIIGITVNKVSDNLLQKQQLISHFNPVIESMEGAAFHYVCLQENIPFIQLRTISNYVGERNKANWKLKEAIEKLHFEINQLIQGLS